MIPICGPCPYVPLYQISLSNIHYIILLEVTMNLIEESLSAPIQKCKHRMVGQKWLCILIILDIWHVPLTTKKISWQILLNFGRLNIVIVTAVLADSMAEPAKRKFVIFDRPDGRNFLIFYHFSYVSNIHP